MKKWLKITLITLGSIIALILLILLFVTLFAGSIAKNYVNSHGEELIGRHVNVEQIGVNVFNGHVYIHDLNVYEEDGTTLFAGFDTLDVSVRLRRLIASEVYVRHITLAGLDVNVEQNGERFNFSSILDKFATTDEAEEEPETDTTPSSWVIDLHNIRLANGNVNYQDLVVGSKWGINDLNLLIPDFCIGGGSATNGGLSLQLADGGTLHTDLAYDTKSNDFDIKLQLDQFALNQAKPYLASTVNVNEIGGRLTVHANAAGNLSKIMETRVNGTVAITKLDVVDGKNSSVASIDSIGVTINDVDLANNKFDIASVAINGLKTKYETYATHNSFSTLLAVPSAPDTAKAQPAEADSAAAATSQPIDLHLGHFELTNSSVTYADYTMPDPFVFPINKLTIKSDDLSLSGENKASIFAALPNGGHAMIRWEGNISNWKKHQHLNLRIEDLHLTDLSPYLVAYLGQPFEDGTFSFISNNNINNSELKGDNHIDIYKATVGKHRKDVKPEMRLPLKAALYVLKDKDEKILLDVPISGNIDKPEFNYMKLVWKTLGQLIVKVATSPARALGNALHGDDDGTLFIAIDTASRDFTSEQYYQIDKVGEMAKTDESIIITFNQQAAPVAGTDSMPQQVEFRNNILRHHLQQLGLQEQQIEITTTPTEGIKNQGYKITSRIAEITAE